MVCRLVVASGASIPGSGTGDALELVIEPDAAIAAPLVFAYLSGR